MDADDPNSAPVDVKRGLVEWIAANVLAATGRIIYSNADSSWMPLNVRPPDGAGDAGCESFVRIVLRGEPVSALYGSSGIVAFTGARVSGSIEFTEGAKRLGQVQFLGVEETATSIADIPGIRGSNPSGAPFERAMTATGGFMGALFSFMGDSFGYEYLSRLRDLWIRGYQDEELARMSGPQFLSNEDVAAGLRDLHSPHAVPYLLNFLQRGADHNGALSVVAASALALGHSGQACAVEPLIDALEEGDDYSLSFGWISRSEVRHAAIRALGSLRTARALEAMEDVASDEGLDDPWLRELAAAQLGRDEAGKGPE